MGPIDETWSWKEPDNRYSDWKKTFGKSVVNFWMVTSLLRLWKSVDAKLLEIG